MNKTLHRKLTAKHLYNAAGSAMYTGGDDMLPGRAQDMKILYAAAKDLMQPRPEAIAYLLKMAKDL